MGPKRNLAEDLESINRPRFRQLVKSEGSFDIALNDFISRMRFKFRKSHLLDQTLPNLAIFSLAVAAIIFTLTGKSELKDNDRRSISSGILGTAVAVVTFINSSHSTRHDQKLNKASDYLLFFTENLKSQHEKVRHFMQSTLTEYYEEMFDPERFNLLRNSLADFKSSPDRIAVLAQLQSHVLDELTKPESPLAEAFIDILNFFEAMGQDVKLNVADSDYLKEYFYSTIINTYQICRKYIEYKQYKCGSRGLWCNLTFLAQTWEKENVPPEIPIICIRPLVITKDDIQKADQNSSGQTTGH